MGARITSLFGSNAGPHATVNAGGNTRIAVSSFGLDHTTLGPAFPAQQLYASERSQELEFRSRYYRCTQHDHKVFDFGGRMRSPSRHATQPLIGGALPSFYVPLDQRRPSAPYRLARTIVARFTGLLFGQGRWPNVLSDDPATQDFCDALVKETGLHSKLLRARNFGGAAGAVGLSWWFDDGTPKVRVHQARHLIVQQWEDEDELVPAHVIELYQFHRDEFDADKKDYVRVWYWSRRDWTRQADVVFLDQRVAKKNPTEWVIDENKSVVHNDGACHFVWIQNLPDDDEAACQDGQPDYAELYEQLDILDILNSVHTKGTIVNLDPTLVVQMHAEEMGDATIQKGSDNALAVGPNGGAQYLTLGSDAVTAGQTAINGQRDQVLETAQCIIPDPNEVVAAGTSSVALRLMFAPMLNKADILRDQYGSRGILRLLDQMLASARSFMPDLTADAPEQQYVYEVQMDQDGNPLLDDAGNPVEEPVEYTLNLPPRIEKVEVLDEEGNPTGEFTTELYARHPGKGRIILEWPEYFPLTAADRQQEAGALTTANGGKPLMSQKSSVEQWAVASDRDGQEEFTQIRDEQQQERDAAAGMFPEIGGRVDNHTPTTGEPVPTPDDPALEEGQPLDDEDEVPEVNAVAGTNLVLAPTDIASVVTVNEARQSQGLPPLVGQDGQRDPDGLLTVAEFRAKRDAAAKAAAEQASREAEAAFEAQQAAEATASTPPAEPPPLPPVLT